MNQPQKIQAADVSKVNFQFTHHPSSITPFWGPRCLLASIHEPLPARRHQGWCHHKRVDPLEPGSFPWFKGHCIHQPSSFENYITQVSVYSAYCPLITPKCHPYVREVSFTCSEFCACQGAHSFSVSSPGKTSHLQKWFMQAAFWRLIGSAMFSLTFTRYQNSSQGTPQSARSHTDRILCPGHNAAPIGAQGNGDFIGRSQLPRKVVDPTFAHLKNGRGLKLTWFSLQFTIFSNGWCFVLPLASTNCLFRLCLLWPV